MLFVSESENLNSEYFFFVMCFTTFFVLVEFGDQNTILGKNKRTPLPLTLYGRSRNMCILNQYSL